MSTTETISILSPYTLDRARRKFEQAFNGHLPDVVEEFLRDVDAFRKERKVVDLLELHERIHVSSKRLASVVGGGMWAELIGLIVKQIDERKAEAENLEYTVLHTKCLSLSEMCGDFTLAGWNLFPSSSAVCASSGECRKGDAKRCIGRMCLARRNRLEGKRTGRVEL